MSRYVVDASAAVEYLLRTPLGLKLEAFIADAFILAPGLLEVEVLSVLRRAVLSGQLAEQRAQLAIDDLQAWPIDRIAHAGLLQEAWRHRHNISAYDAIYVAAAKISQASLLTADGPLSRVPVPGVVIHNIRLSP